MVLRKDSFKKGIIQSLFISIIVFGFVSFGVVQSFGEDRDFSKVLFCEGAAEVMFSGSDKWVPLIGDMKIGVGDEVRTKSDGMVDLELPDGSIIKVGTDSSVAIKEMGMVEVTELSINSFGLILGKIRAVVMPLVNVDSRFIIETGNSTVGVRGTDFGVYYDPENDMTELMCLDGSVDIIAKEMVTRGMRPKIVSKNLRAIRVKPGRMMSVVTGVAPGKPQILSDKRRDLFFGAMNFRDENVIKRIERIKRIKRERREWFFRNLLNKPGVNPGVVEENTPSDLNAPYLDIPTDDGRIRPGGGNESNNGSIGGGGNVSDGGSPGGVNNNQ